MNWDAISAIGEAIGAVAVVISLIYLAVQIRQNTQQIKNSIAANQLAAFERNVESGNRSREFLLAHPKVFDLYLKGSRSFDELDGKEKARFGLIVRNMFSAIQGSYIRQSYIGHDPEDFRGISKVVDQILSAPGVQEFLQTIDLDWRPEFKTFVDERLAHVLSNPT